MSAIRLKDIGKHFRTHSGHAVMQVLDGVGLEQPSGQFLAVMGPSGCGKSTLLNIIAGFEKADTGECLVAGHPVSNAGPDRGVVFQEYALFPWMTVERNITFGMRAAGKWKAGAQEKVDAILDQMELSAFRRAFPKQLSGGMRQRVAIARLIAIDSPVMLMDEPFGALDALTRSILQEELVALWQRTRKTIFFVTHSVDEAIYLADRVVVMTPRPGRIVLDLAIDLPRPRDVTKPRFNEYKRQVLEIIKPTLKEHLQANSG